MMRLRKVTHGSASVDTTSTLLLAADERRKYAEIINTSDTAMWMALGEAAQVGRGIYVAANGFAYEINSENLWTGTVYGIVATGSGKTAATTEMK